jgi:hypothetical protein
MQAGKVIGRTIILSIGLALLAGAGLILADRGGLIDLPRRYDPLALPNLDETPNWITKVQLKYVDASPLDCALSMSRTGLNATLTASRNQGVTCALERPLTLVRLSQARLRPEQTRCNIAARLYMWEKHSVQPAAKRFFRESVAEILHFGSYSCRTIAGSSAMSEHATANAFDIAGFRLKSGRVISVLKDWPQAGPARQFLVTVHEGACDYFNLTLSPDYNAAHRDHFHVDMGWVRGCR